MTRRLTAIAAALLLASCTTRQPASELLVVVGTDITTLDRIDVDVSGPDRGAPFAHSFLLPATHLPLSFAVVPVNGDPDRMVTIHATGLTAGAVRVRVFAVSHFVRDQVRVLSLFLSAACTTRYAGCETTAMTCSAGSCVPPTIDPSMLPRIDVDAGARDGGLRDTGISDLSADAALPGTGERCTGACAPGNECVSLSGEPTFCRHFCDPTDPTASDCAAVNFSSTSKCAHDPVTGADICTTGCDARALFGCPVGSVCDFYSTGSFPISSITATDCRAAGSGVRGSPCTSPVDCSNGFTCIGFSTGGACTGLCDPAATTDSCLPFGRCNTAAASPTGVSYCVPLTDAGVPDAGHDAGRDAGRDAGPSDLGMPDLGPSDMGPPDLGPPDLGPPDLGPPDAGPADMPSTVPTCTDYCTAVIAACTGASAQYGSLADCMTTCTSFAWAAGTVADASGDTLGCRQRAATAGTPDCAAAGPLGGGVCGASNCADFCAANLAVCTSIHMAYADVPTCVANCSGYALGVSTDSTINSLWCRLSHLTLAVADAAGECPNTALTGGSQCVM